jgi:hypothetical protein
MSELQHDVCALRGTSPVPTPMPTPLPDPARSRRHGRLYEHVVRAWHAWVAEGAASGAGGLVDREVLALLDQAIAESGCLGPAEARQHARRIAAESYARVD